MLNHIDFAPESLRPMLLYIAGAYPDISINEMCRMVAPKISRKSYGSLLQWLDGYEARSGVAAAGTRPQWVERFLPDRRSVAASPRL